MKKKGARNINEKQRGQLLQGDWKSHDCGMCKDITTHGRFVVDGGTSKNDGPAEGGFKRCKSVFPHSNINGKRWGMAYPVSFREKKKCILY